MLRCIWVVSNEYALPDLLIIGLQSFFIWDVVESQISEDTNMSEILATARPGLFGDHLLVAFASGRESILKVIGCKIVNLVR